MKGRFTIQLSERDSAPLSPVMQYKLQQAVESKYAELMEGLRPIEVRTYTQEAPCPQPSKSPLT